MCDYISNSWLSECLVWKRLKGFDSEELMRRV